MPGRHPISSSGRIGDLVQCAKSIDRILGLDFMPQPMGGCHYRMNKFPREHGKLLAASLALPTANCYEIK